jgi:ABC-type lipoprotein release transport system permease subunit
MNLSAIGKQRYILDLALSSMARRKGKNIALVMVYTFTLFMLASVVFSVDSLKHEAALTLQDTPEITVQRQVAGRQDLIPLAYADSISRIKGVQSVEPRLWGYYYDAFSGANYTLMANTALSDRTGDMVIGAGVARRNDIGKTNRKLGKNDMIPFITADGAVLPLTVRGLFPPASELVTADLVLMPESDFRKIFTIGKDHATDLVVKAGNGEDPARIAGEIGRIHPDTRQILRQDILRTYEAVFDWRGGMIAMLLAGILFPFVILAWDRATGLNAEEKREIGILKAVGWETSDILLMKFWEGAAISLAAFFMGVLLAYCHIFLASSMLFESVLQGWSVLYPHFRLTPYVNAYQVAALFFLTVIPYTVVTVVPSWRSATIDPDSVTRI